MRVWLSHLSFVFELGCGAFGEWMSSRAASIMR
jgi:hypothetical protein